MDHRKFKWLNRLELPKDLRMLSAAELEEVSAEIRQVILETVSSTGGHLSSNLGNVELTVAIHASFESPHDRILWDTGHQAYAHKILTGRLHQMSTLRQRAGLSGFPTPAESRHDHFITGHEGTGLSSALGVAQARDLKQEDYAVVVVIGDATLTSGMALEAINNIPHLKSNLVIILNDNEMSISPNVGAMARYFTQIRTNPFLRTFKERVEKIFERIPRIGVPLVQRAEQLRHRVERLMMERKAGVIFEELGYKYVGPVDGYNMPMLLSVLHYAKDVKQPVLIHVVTHKGKGYLPAEEDPSRFHTTPAFVLETGEPTHVSSAETYSSVFGKAMVRMAERNERLVGITAAMCDGTGLDIFAERFPQRFFDVGIAEEHAVTFAAALAKEGFDPVFAVYSTFLQRSFDQILHDVCLQNLHVVLCLDRAGIVGQDAPTHTGAYDLAYLRLMPNMVVAAPKDENELQHLLFTAIHYAGPMAIRYPRGKGGGVPLDNTFQTIPIGQGEILYETPAERMGSGKVIGILAVGYPVALSLAAAHILEEHGFRCVVVNARYVKPLDKKLILDLAGRIDALVTVEEAARLGGFGSAVLELLAEESMNNIPIRVVGLPDAFIEHGKEPEIREELGMTPQGIASQALSLFESRKHFKFELSRIFG